ncbi:hypothetical protein GWO43_19070 [candidate division KSB1 bacterium]|nr:hypothetical protein [candidate division KSB1 bacterium]NIR71187.1 hypothetical protein [candidate division KSB1 bacterium]NIS26172.1 hypothetical protein [candidate division KSB1 bacterium]NIT72937.1 hypothetical protein [candidate division KSB1 bacterium]NIU26819.1 hypothetical protein [candidate division KSB1 bacterium]
MLIISINLIIFGVAGLALSIYLFLNVESPIFKTQDEKPIIGTGLSFQTILNLIFIYFMVLHFMFILVGVNFLLT